MRPDPDWTLALLYYTWQSRFLTHRQFQEKFWPQLSQRAVAARLQRLEAAGALRSHPLPWLPERRLYGIATRGLQSLLQAGFQGIPARDAPRPEEAFTPGRKHDLDLVDLRIACERSGYILQWTSEHELRLARRQGQGLARIVDGAFHYQSLQGEAPGLLEYERIGYSKRLYLDILHRLRMTAQSWAGASVFFICPSPQRAATLRRWAASSLLWALAPQQLYFGDFATVRSSGLKESFVDLVGAPLPLPALAEPHGEG